MTYIQGHFPHVRAALWRQPLHLCAACCYMLLHAWRHTHTHTYTRLPNTQSVNPRTTDTCMHGYTDTEAQTETQKLRRADPQARRPTDKDKQTRRHVDNDMRIRMHTEKQRGPHADTQIHRQADTCMQTDDMCSRTDMQTHRTHHAPCVLYGHWRMV